MIPLSEKTKKRVEALFHADDREEAERLLREECADNIPFCGNANPGDMERVRFAALKLSKGSIAELKRWIDLAKIDWRDLLVAAGDA